MGFNNFDIEKISELRKQLGLTQKEIANLAGVSQSLIAKIEAGSIDPAYSKVVAIFTALEAEMNKNAKTKGAHELMTKGIIYVRPSDNLRKAMKLMKEKNISQLPVVENNDVVGSVSDSMLPDWISEYGGRVSNITIVEVMRESFPIIPYNANSNLVIDLLKYYKAVLVKKGNKVVGIITKADLIKAISK